MIAKKMVRDHEKEAFISSAATTNEEIGNDIYPPMRRELNNRGIPLESRCARKTTKQDYKDYDYIIGMDEENRHDLYRIYGGDPDLKISLLMEWAGEHREVSDPWYTRNFAEAADDIEQGCAALLQQLGLY